jgi:hypothetical protein
MGVFGYPSEMESKTTGGTFGLFGLIVPIESLVGKILTRKSSQWTVSS